MNNEARLDKDTAKSSNSCDIFIQLNFNAIYTRRLPQQLSRKL